MNKNQQKTPEFALTDSILDAIRDVETRTHSFCCFKPGNNGTGLQNIERILFDTGMTLGSKQ